MSPGPSLRRSRFREIYIALGFLLGLSIYLFSWVFDRILIPRILSNRVQGVERLVRSSYAKLDQHDVRSVRDEIIASGLIRHDRDFDLLRPGSPEDRQREAVLFGSCKRWIGEQTCISDVGDALVYSSARGPIEETSSFAVVLRRSSFDQDYGLSGWLTAGICSISLLFTALVYGIRRKEKELLGKIDLLAQAMNRVPGLLGVPADLRDEFEAASSTIAQLAASLEQRTRMLGSYQTWLKRQTRRDQLRQTLAHSAHDFRAPLEETVDFLLHMPMLIQELSPEALRESVASLESRVRSGLRSLDNALRSTMADAEGEQREKMFSLGEVFELLRGRVASHPRVRSVSVDFPSRELVQHIRLVGNADIFQSALWNLIENSSQARADARITISAAEEAGDILKLHVADNGPGVPVDLHEDIFCEFVSTKTYGSGLGLPSARRVVESMQGTLCSVPSDFGAVFEIELPCLIVCEEVSHA